MHRSFPGVVLLVAACRPTPNLGAERAAIMHADSAWLHAAQAKLVDSTLTFWTPDARVIGTGQPAFIGREAIRGMLQNGFSTPAFSVTWTTTEVIVAPSGDFAYTFGTNAFTVPNSHAGIDTLRGNGVVVWSKGGDGRWRAAVDTWTPAPAATP